MKLYGQLEYAQLENKSSDDSAGTTGRIWFNTTIKRIKIDDGVIVKEVAISNEQATNDSKFILPYNSYSNLNSLTRKAGAIYFGSDTAKAYVDSGTELKEIAISGETATNNTRFVLSTNTYLNLAGLTRRAGAIYYGSDSLRMYLDDGVALREVAISNEPASESSRFIAPYGTFSNLSALTRKAGAIYYATDKEKMYFDDGIDLRELVTSIQTFVASGIYDAIVGDSEDIENGRATHTSLQTAINELANGKKIFVLRSVSENVTCNKTLKITSAGAGVILTGNFNLTANLCFIESLRIQGNLSISGNYNHVSGWCTGNVSDSGTRNLLNIIEIPT